MIIDLRDLSEDPRHFKGEDPADLFEIKEETMRLSGPVKYDLEAYIVSEELIVTGSLETSVSFVCSKCTESFTVKLEENSFECCKEIVEEPESVDLTGDIREAMLLTFPAYPVCDSDCRGLCPQCGINRNEGACKCAGPEDMRWGKLDKLDIKDS
jgi:uncharacterized protein